MQFRFVKDFAIALIVIALLVLAIRLYAIHIQGSKVPDKSIYTKESVSDTLLNRIKTIETSIQDRKMFTFNSTRDPLRQGNIIKDKVDREKEYADMIRNTFRLSTTAFDEFGNKIAYVEYMDKIYGGRVGDVIEGRRISSIGENTMTYYYGGGYNTISVQPRPRLTPQEQAETTNNLGDY
ncbi:MAG TPA: hypothetical protein PL124_03760 [Candidatus Cloacimonadota bacterium]|nr:hypothetical protein [Candidatus Cloacimonadota bacterium]HPS38506.1 hypothetical protein [Candidatus Cloacimonadota bacterium]